MQNLFDEFPVSQEALIPLLIFAHPPHLFDCRPTAGTSDQTAAHEIRASALRKAFRKELAVSPAGGPKGVAEKFEHVFYVLPAVFELPHQSALPAIGIFIERFEIGDGSRAQRVQVDVADYSI